MNATQISKLPENQRFAAYQAMIAAGRQDSLAQRIDAHVGLTESELDSAVAVLGSRCQEKTKRRLRSVLRFVSCIESYGILSRVLFENGECHYCAGQSYPDEIRTVRKVLIG